MKNKLLFVTILSFFTCITIGLAQQPLSNAEIIKFKKGVELKAKSTQTIKSDFVQTKQISVLNNKVISKGHLVFMSPNKVKWAYVLPETNIAVFKNNQLLVSDGKKSKTMSLDSNKWFKQLNELIVNSVKGNMFDEAKFEISYLNTGKDYLITFKPKDKRLKKFMTQFELIFPYRGFEVKSVKLVEPNKDFTLIEFKNRVNNSSVSETEFNL
jgi:outer membrane lipoprotein-sorting protein